MIFTMSLLLFLAPIKVEQGRFNILKDGKRIGTDEYAITMRGMNYVIDGKVTIGSNTTSSQMELDPKLVPVSYQVSSPEGRIRINIVNPLSEVQTMVGAESSTQNFRFPAGGVILDNDFFHHYLVLMYRVQAGQTSFGIFVPRDGSIGSATVRATGGRNYDLQIGDVRMQAVTDVEGRLLKLTVPSANVVVER